MAIGDAPRVLSSQPGWRDDDPLIPNTDGDLDFEENPYVDDGPGDRVRDTRD